MDIRININQHILAWLASRGHVVAGMPRERVEGMFRREARQVPSAPERLEGMWMESVALQPTYPATRGV